MPEFYNLNCILACADIKDLKLSSFSLMYARSHEKIQRQTEILLSHQRIYNLVEEKKMYLQYYIDYDKCCINTGHQLGSPMLGECLSVQM